MSAQRYKLDVAATTVQCLVDVLRRMPHHQVDAELASIRLQCTAQDLEFAREQKTKALEAARALVATTMSVNGAADARAIAKDIALQTRKRGRA